MEKKFVAIEPNIWKPENKEDKIEGTLVGKKEKVGVNESMLYYIEDEDKKTFGIWGSAVLDDRMTLVGLGDYIRITYKGKETNKKGQHVNIFKVEKAISS